MGAFAFEQECTEWNRNHKHTRKKLAQPRGESTSTTDDWGIMTSHTRSTSKSSPPTGIQVIGWQRGGSVFAPLLWVYCGFTFSCGVPFHIPFSFSLFVNGIKKKEKKNVTTFLLRTTSLPQPPHCTVYAVLW